MNRIPRVIIKDETRTINNIVRFLEKTRCTATKSRVNSTTRKELIAEVGMEGFVLFHYYVGRQNFPNFLFTDGATAQALGLPIRKVATIRKRLIKTGWFLQYNVGVDPKTKEYMIRTILGKQNVLDARRKGKEKLEEDLKEMFPKDEL